MLQLVIFSQWRYLVSRRVGAKSSRAKVRRRRFGLGFLMFELANMADSGVKHFRFLYDSAPTRYLRYSDEDLLRLRDELRVMWEFEGGRKKSIGSLQVRSFLGGPRAERLWRRLERVPDEPVPKVVCNYWLRSEKQPFEVIWTKQEKKFRPRPQSLPAMLAWGCVHYWDYLKFCANENCKYPYFIAGRMDQKYCSGKCAAPAKREAKRRWWSAHRSKLASKKEGSRSPL
jgi:hypothetical protein